VFQFVFQHPDADHTTPRGIDKPGDIHDMAVNVAVLNNPELG